MSKAYLGAFVAIASIAVGAVDYVNQAKAAGSSPGQFGLGNYVYSISGRFAGPKVMITETTTREQLLAMAPRDLLPEPSAGWSRRDWDATSASDVPEAGTALKAPGNTDGVAPARQQMSETYVYEKPGAKIALRLQILGPGVIAAADTRPSAGDRDFAIVRGIAFREAAASTDPGPDRSDDRMIIATIGEEVNLSLRASAPDADIIAMLNTLDYDLLNRLLSTPRAEVGSAPSRTGVFAPTLVKAPIAAPTAAVAPEPRDEGIVGNILSALGFGTADPTPNEDIRIEPAADKKDVSITPFGGGTCKKTGIGKSCKIGG